MMKKFLYVFVSLLFTANFFKAQSNELDKKWRFGLRITPQSTWYSSGDKNNIPKGVNFGFGFGLNVERRFSDIVSLLTGIGGDFEGGKYTLRHDTSAAGNYMPAYWEDESGLIAKPASGKKKDNTVRYLKERKINSTFVTIPLLLKLSTKEYSGLKFYGLFGGEIGIRARILAKDTYYETRKYTDDVNYVYVSGETTESDVNIGKDASLIPMRLGFNVGLGAEYRMASTTAAFISVNFFKAFTNTMRKESNYLYYRTYDDNGKENYRMVQQNLLLNAVRINVGIMF